MEDLTEPWKPYRSLGKLGGKSISQAEKADLSFCSCVLHVGLAGGELKRGSFISRTLPNRVDRYEIMGVFAIPAG
jgi:hypothetical protein